MQKIWRKISYKQYSQLCFWLRPMTNRALNELQLWFTLRQSKLKRLTFKKLFFTQVWHLRSRRVFTHHETVPYFLQSIWQEAKYWASMKTLGSAKHTNLSQIWLNKGRIIIVIVQSLMETLNSSIGGVKYLMEENLKVVWAELSTLS